MFRAKLLPYRAIASLLCVVAVAVAAPARADLSVDAPKRVDPFTGIMDRALLTPSSVKPLPGANERKVAVLLTQNTAAHMAWTEERARGQGGLNRGMVGAFFGGDTIADMDRLHAQAYDPKRVTEGLLEPLTRRVRSMRVIQSVGEFQDSDDDWLVLLDVSFLNLFFNSPVLIGNQYKAGMTAELFVIDRDGALRTVAASIERKSSAARYLQDVTEIRGEVLKRYALALEALLGPEVPAAPAQPAAILPPAAAPSTPADRLRALEQLFQQGLVTPDEYARKRQEILGAL